jgi:hypothetical protein
MECSIIIYIPHGIGQKEFPTPITTNSFSEVTIHRGKLYHR